MRTVPRQAPARDQRCPSGWYSAPPWLLSSLSPASWPPLPRERLKPHAIDIRVNIDPVHWFLSPPRDTRSSLYLEDAATEFQVQGLELDWTIVTWDADLRWRGSDWSYHSFRGAKWTDVKKPERRQYLKNAYRVLLTRARQGMVIFVPPGAKRDLTPSRFLYQCSRES